MSYRVFFTVDGEPKSVECDDHAAAKALATGLRAGDATMVEIKKSGMPNTLLHIGNYCRRSRAATVAAGK